MQLALAIPRGGVDGSGWVTKFARSLAIRKVRGSREASVAPPSCDPRQAFTLSSHWVAGQPVGSQDRTLAGSAKRERVEAHGTGITSEPLHSEAAQALSLLITFSGENTLKVTVTPCEGQFMSLLISPFSSFCHGNRVQRSMACEHSPSS